MTRHTGRQMVADALRDRIVTGLHLGRYRGGERLPNARALAAEFKVNERVVLAALRALADEGFVSLRPRSGAYVAMPHPGGGAALPDLGAWLVTMLVQARARGLAPRDVSEYARRALETRRVHAACIECNRDQTHLLCTELANDHGFITAGAEVGELTAAAPSLALRRADLLVTTVFHAAEVEAAAQRLGKPWIAVALRPEAFAEVGRALHEGPVYFVATDSRVEPKLQRMLAPVGPLENLRVVVLDRDDVGVIPDDAPTFVMSSAREQLLARGARPDGPGRPLHPPRMFSDQTARELLTFIVRMNSAALSAAPTPARS